MNEPIFRTRRDFLRMSLLGGAWAWTLPSFVHATIQSLATAAADAATPATGKDHPILVVLQLAGGNDGLNTIIPVEDDHYFRARPTLAIRKEAALRLADGVGLHPALSSFKDLYDDGRIAIVQGVGYPNPNRSHFRSMEIWQTASDANKTESTGWIGRFFDSQCPPSEAAAGICIGAETPQAFATKRPKGVTLQSAAQYRLLTGDAGEDEDALFRRMNRIDDDDAGRSIEGLAGGHARRTEESPIDFLERTALDAQVSSDNIRRYSGRALRTAFPGTRLGRDLQLTAQLIGGGMSTRIYYVSHGGFDTHTNQQGAHERLLREFSEALAAFLAEMKAQANDRRVLVMTFSEFGRRVAQNGSGGTDHGAAAPMFLAGGALAAGIHGNPPDLNPKRLDQGDLRHSIDFRSVYATVLARHLGVDPTPILKREFPRVASLG